MGLTLNLRREIQAPVEQVYNCLTKVESFPQWLPNCVGVELMSSGQTRVGTRWRESRKMFGKTAQEIFEVTGLQEHRFIELYCDGRNGTSKRGEYRFKYDLSPMNGRTLIVLSGEIGGMGRIWTVLGRLFMGIFKRMMAKDLEALDKHLSGCLVRPSVR